MSRAKAGNIGYSGPNHGDSIQYFCSRTRWFSVDRVGLMTWWLWVRDPVEAKFLSGVFSPLTSAEACEKTSRWVCGKEICVSTGVRKPGNTYMCVTDHYDMTLSVKVALNLNTSNQPTYRKGLEYDQRAGITGYELRPNCKVNFDSILSWNIVTDDHSFKLGCFSI